MKIQFFDNEHNFIWELEGFKDCKEASDYVIKNYGEATLNNEDNVPGYFVYV